MRQIQALFFNGSNPQINFDKHPNRCPFCHDRITPKICGAYFSKGILEIVYRCTNEDCQRIFLAYYEKNVDVYYLESTSIGTHESKYFSENIKEISPNFIEIYNQASLSEYYKLEHISGIGYRKALEFLVKDYLISKDSENSENIKNKFLGKVIHDDIENQNLKDIAKRAAWLGNDETHYVRKWIEKDIKDLKILIEIAIHWMDMELLTEQYKEDMN